MADLIRSAGVAPQECCRELFSRMVFNIVIENTDDHEKNHAILVEGGRWKLSPAFDVQPQLQDLNHKQLCAGKQRNASSPANAVSDAGRILLKPDKAIDLARGIAARAADWEQAFAQNGVSPQDINACRTFILRPSAVDLQSFPRRATGQRRNTASPRP